MAGGEFTCFMAMRYLLHSERRFARLIGWISFAGLFLGVLVLTTVVSVMNGFDAELRTRLLGSVPHLMVLGADPADARFDALREDPMVASTYGFFVTQGMVTRGSAVNPVTLFGVGAEGPAQMRSIREAMVVGDLEDLFGPRAAASNYAVMGAPLALHLGLRPGDSVLVMVPRGAGGSVQPQLHRLTLGGLFELGAELDYNLLITSREMFSARERASSGKDGVRVQLVDALRAPGFAAELSARFDGMPVRSWADTYGELFEAVRLEKAMMFLILLLVVAVAGFNIVSGQTMVVHDKRADIAVLRTLGATHRLIRNLFLLQGVAVALAGIALGLAAGVLLAMNIGDVVATLESWLGFRVLEGTYFVRVPSRVELADVLIIGAVSLLLCVLAAWWPARRAAAQNPVAALHGAT